MRFDEDRGREAIGPVLEHDQIAASQRPHHEQEAQEGVEQAVGLPGVEEQLAPDRPAEAGGRQHGRHDRRRPALAPDHGGDAENRGDVEQSDSDGKPGVRPPMSTGSASRSNCSGPGLFTSLPIATDAEVHTPSSGLCSVNTSAARRPKKALSLIALQPPATARTVATTTGATAATTLTPARIPGRTGQGRSAAARRSPTDVAASAMRPAVNDHSVRTLTSPEQRPAGRDGPGSGVGGCSNR